MPHVRTQIRDYVIAALKDLPTTGARVYAGRTRPLPARHEPTLLVYMRSETVSLDARGAPPVARRAVTLHIEGRVATEAEPDDLLDTIAAEVEAVMMAGMIDYVGNRVMGGLAANLEFIGSEIIAEAQGETQIGGIRLEYRVTYRAPLGAPEATC